MTDLTFTTRLVFNTLEEIAEERVHGLTFTVNYTASPKNAENAATLETLKQVRLYVANEKPEALTKEMKEAIIQLCKHKIQRLAEKAEMLEREFKAFENLSGYLDRKAELEDVTKKLNDVKRVNEFFRNFYL